MASGTLLSLLLLAGGATADLTADLAAISGAALAVIGGDHFDVKVDAPKQAAKGKRASAKITIAPAAGWHMNLDYPTKLEMAETRGVSYAKAKQTKADATRLDADGAGFEIAFTPSSKGKKELTGKLKFAVCKEDQCAPKSVPVKVTLNVK